MSMEMMSVVAGAVLLVAAVLTYFTFRGRRGRTASPIISVEDRRLLPYLKLTQDQWLALTDVQRAGLRERVPRTLL